MAETEVINETKKWLESEGINLEFLNQDRKTTPRDESVLLIKNLPSNSSTKGLRELFEHYGSVTFH